VQAGPPKITIEVLPGEDGELRMPHHTTEALSTDE
jgi:hypothetical protein